MARNHTELVAWLRHKIIDAVRFIALDAADQETLCPPFTSVASIEQEDLDSAIEHAEGVQLHTGATIMSNDQFAEMKGLVRCVQEAIEATPNIDENGSQLPDTPVWNEIRMRARALLSKYGCAGEIDVNLHKYSDPKTGMMIVPRLKRNTPE